MNVRNTLKTTTAATLIALALGGAAAQAETTIEIQRHPAPGWNDGPHFPPRVDDVRQDARSDKRQERIDLRQDDMLERILNGIESGRMDRRESVSALRDLRDIGKLERAYLADGYLSSAEFQNLDDRLDTAERRLFRDKRDFEWGR
jgi:hypothetical protein